MTRKKENEVLQEVCKKSGRKSEIIKFNFPKEKKYKIKRAKGN